MQILYVDESGDPGLGQFSSNHFILSGLIVSQQHWEQCLVKLKTFRKTLSQKYGLNQRLEIHASELIRLNKNEAYKAIRKTDRINILKDYIGQVPAIFDTCQVINICLDKTQHREVDIFKLAWSRLIQRYDTFLKKDAKDKGIIICDDTQSVQLMRLLRKMRVYNPVPSQFGGSYNAPTDFILEDPFSRGSSDSYFIQTVDVIAHLLYRKEYPKGSLKKFGLEQQFLRLEPILLKKASKEDDLGIVRK